MAEPLAFLNGRLIPASQLSVSVYDSGFVQGVTVTERMRTFASSLFRLEDHFARLAHSLEIVGIEIPLGMNELAERARQLARDNHGLLDPDDDLGMVLFVTPGIPSLEGEPAKAEPTVCLHTQVLPFRQWSEIYERGQALVLSDVQQVPASCWPAELKCRSRMHYYLADRVAASTQPGARAILLDGEGYVSEASTANILLFERASGLVSPPRQKILPGVSLQAVEELATGLGIPFFERDLTVRDLEEADEVLLCSTSPCLLPVVQLDGRPLGGGAPGDLFRRLLAAWSQQVGVDIRQQAHRFSQR